MNKILKYGATLGVMALGFSSMTGCSPKITQTAKMSKAEERARDLAVQKGEFLCMMDKLSYRMDSTGINTYHRIDKRSVATDLHLATKTDKENKNAIYFTVLVDQKQEMLSIALATKGAPFYFYDFKKEELNESGNKLLQNGLQSPMTGRKQPIFIQTQPK